MTGNTSKPKTKGTSRARSASVPKANVTKTAKVETKSKSNAAAERAIGDAASQLIDQRIRDIGGWRGETLARMRALILEADSEMIEEWKWMGTPVWSHCGNVCTGETYKQVVKLTFARGAFLKDNDGLFNSSLEGNLRRAMDIHEGETLDNDAFKALIQAAVAENLRFHASRAKTSAKRTAKRPQPKGDEK